MNKLVSSMIGATLLAAPFSIQASEVNLDDTYRFESTSPYETVTHKSPSRHVDVSSSDMYRYEDSGPYNQGSIHLSSGEVTEIAVFSSTTRESGPAIPGYIGNY